MYGTDWCPHCQAQKRLFGSSFQYVNYVNCDLSADACQVAGVQGYPTWVFPNGKSLSGEQELETLASQVACQVQ
jgi:glutaredoxin